MSTEKVFGKFAIMFIFEVEDYQNKDISDDDVIDFFSDSAMGMDLITFDWKEQEQAQKWIAKIEKKGYEVQEVDDSDDASYLVAFRPEMWPTIKYICKKLMTNSPLFTTPDL